jgi:hypothetical protein
MNSQIHSNTRKLVSTIASAAYTTSTPISSNIKPCKVKNALKKILGGSKKHNAEILKCSTIKSAHIYCKVHKLSGQVSGPLIEMFIKTKYAMVKNSASMCIGDLHHKNTNTNFEIKMSNGGKANNKFNYVQLRINHTCDYVLTAYYLDAANVETYGELFMFKLNKSELKALILKYGGYAHGTVQKLGRITKKCLENPENDKEYAIRPTYNDKCWQELIPFRVYNL